MCLTSSIRPRHSLTGAVVFALLSGTAGTVPLAQQGAPSPAVRATQLDVTVVSKEGRPYDGLGPSQFAVSVDGKPRRVLWVRQVSRGPGATAEAVRRQSGRTDVLEFAAEPARNVLLVIDEYSIPPGGEKAAMQAAVALVDRLGLDDRVAVMRVPVGRDSRLDLTTERPEVRAALRQIVGRAVTTGARPADPFGNDRLGAAADDPTRATGDPDRTSAERERPPTETASVRPVGDELPVQNGLLPSLLGVIGSLRESPGRKVVAVFSAGVQTPTGQGPVGPGVDDVARAAAASRTAVYVFGLQGGRDDPDRPMDVGALERLARASGGTFASLGKNADKTVEKIVPELSGTYVVGVEPLASDSDGKRHAVRVEVPGLPVSVRSHSWYGARTDPADVVPPAEAPPAGAAPAQTGVTIADSASGGRKPSGGAGDAEAAAREVELQRVLARAVDYVTGFQREYSMLVAEEHYSQRARGERQELKSDLLLVKMPGTEGWVSFRDVFEVNGRPVRDREERLKKLFLDSSPEAQAQMRSIKDESARYNIGQVVRNINVPLFPMQFLDPNDVWRCRFRLVGTKDVAGVSAVKVAWTETSRPTVVRLNEKDDIAAGGTFLIDAASGAVVGTTLQFTFPGDRGSIEFVVNYERDATLGMWVPAEMTEVFTVQRTAGVDRQIAIDARATYSRFRRFQVKTEEDVKIKK